MNLGRVLAVLNDNRIMPVVIIAAGVGLLIWKNHRTELDFSQLPPVGTTFLTNHGLLVSG